MNPVVHFEMPAFDMERAKKFYEKVFGWDVVCGYDNYYNLITADIGQNGYMSSAPGAINGAIQIKDDTIGGTRLIIQVEDLEIAVQKAIEEGAKILIPKRKTPRLYYSVISDSEGNELNLVEAIK
jgi:uncharacterized protein